MFCKGESLIQISMAFNINMKVFTEQQNWRSPGPTQPRYFTTCTNNWKKGVSFNQQGLFSTLRCDMISLQNKHIHNKSFNTYYEPPTKFKKQNFTEQRVDFYPVFEGIVQGIDDILTNITKIESMKAENSSVDNFISLNKSVDSINQELKNKEIDTQTTIKFPNIHIKDQNYTTKITDSKLDIDSDNKAIVNQNTDSKNNISVPAETPSDKSTVNTTEVHVNATAVAREDLENIVRETPIVINKITSSNNNKTMVSGGKKNKKQKNKNNRRKGSSNADCNNSKNNKMHHNKTINKSRNKKHKNINVKSDKHKMKHSTLCDIIEDSYYENTSDSVNTTNGPNSSWLTERPFKKNSLYSTDCAPMYEFNLAEAVGTSKMSAMEKCCKFLAKLPICKSINNKPTMKTANLFQCSSTSTDCSVINIPKTDATTAPSECGTEDSFIVYFSESPNKDNQSVSQSKFNECSRSPKFARRPSECDSDNSFVVCFGESSQSPKDCFMIDLDISNTETKRMPEKRETMRTKYPSECESDDFIIFEEEEEDGDKTEEESGSDSDSDSDEDSDSTRSNDSSYFTESENGSTEQEDIGECTCTEVKPNCCADSYDTIDGCVPNRLNFDNFAKNKIATTKKHKKKVSFNLKPTVHVMTVWRFAYQQARKGHWEQLGRDLERFNSRIEKTRKKLEPILVQSHRNKIYKERFENYQY